MVFLFRVLVRRRGEGQGREDEEKDSGVVDALVVVAACLSILAMG